MAAGRRGWGGTAAAREGEGAGALQGLRRAGKGQGQQRGLGAQHRALASLIKHSPSRRDYNETHFTGETEARELAQELAQDGK